MTQTRVRGRLRAAGAVSLALATAAVVTACGSPEPEQPTGRVERGSVAVKVSASGALSSVESQNLGFRTGAQLKELNVKVGDRVQPGQLLAKIDDFRIKNARDIAQASVDSARANLDRVVRGVTVENARRSLDEARRSLRRTEASTRAQVEAAEDAEYRARVKFNNDYADYRQKYASTSPTSGPGGTASSPEKCREKYHPSKIDSASAAKSGGHHEHHPDGGMDASAGIKPEGGGAPSVDPPSGSSPSPIAGGSPLSALQGATAEPATTCNDPALAAAFNTALASKTALISAQNAAITARKGAAVTVQSARTAVTTAENALRAAEVDRPITIAQLTALLESSQALLRNAIQDLEDTVLYAPVAGTVASINGLVGEYIGGGSGTSAQSPGTEAPIPGVGAAASSDQAGAASSGISATRPGGAAFIVLNNLNTFQVVVPFEESDAAQVRPNQRVEVTFDAIPDLTRMGTVLSIAPSGVNISGVTNYYATILLSETDPRLRTGLTAQTGVLVSEADNVLTVPNSAILKEAGKSYVNVKGPDGQAVRKEVQLGQAGTTRTQVLSGVNEGEELLLPLPAPPVTGGEGG